MTNLYILTKFHAIKKVSSCYMRTFHENVPVEYIEGIAI